MRNRYRQKHAHKHFKYQHKLKKCVIVIDGNIGSGKTTLIGRLKEIPTVHVIYEPVEEWKDINGHNILELLYKDPKRWCFSFQMFVFYTRTKVLRDIAECNKNIIFIDRSLFADIAFVNTLYELKCMNDIEYEMYNDIHKWLIDFSGYQNIINGVVYVKTDPQICFNRIKKRARSEENEISLNYLNELDDNHNIVISNIKKPKLFLNNDKDIQNSNLVDQINKWLYSKFKIKMIENKYEEKTSILNKLKTWALSLLNIGGL